MPRLARCVSLANGTDTSGSSFASMDLTARVEADRRRPEQSRWPQRSVGQRQGGDVRRPHDGRGRRPDAQAVRRELRRARRSAAAVCRRSRRCAVGRPGAGGKRRGRRGVAIRVAPVAGRSSAAQRSCTGLGRRSATGCAACSRTRLRERRCAADDRESPRSSSRWRSAGYIAERSFAAALVADDRPRASVAGRGRRRGRQDRGCQGARRRAQDAADPPAVLRRPRRARGDVRMELPAAAAGDQAARAGRAQRRRRRSRTSSPSATC